MVKKSGSRSAESRLQGFEGASFADWDTPTNRANDRGGPTVMGLTLKTYRKLNPKGTEEQFKALTPKEVLGYATSLFHAYGADKIKNVGVAIMIADYFWGGVTSDQINKALVSAGGRGVATVANGLNAAGIREINSVDPQKLMDALYEQRLAYHEADIAAHPNQSIYRQGWHDRATARWIQSKMLTGATDQVAVWLNGRQMSELEPQLGLLNKSEQAQLHESALRAVGPQSRLAQLTQASFEEQQNSAARE